MTKTTNYQLNQWTKSDRIMLDDFNADNQKLDAAIKAAHDSVRIVRGSYVGDGTTNRVVPLEFAPKFMILMGHIFDNSILAVLTAEVFAYSGGCDLLWEFVWYYTPGTMKTHDKYALMIT